MPERRACGLACITRTSARYTSRKDPQNALRMRLKELRQLRDENSRLKKLVADLSLDKHILQEILSKKV